MFVLINQDVQIPHLRHLYCTKINLNQEVVQLNQVNQFTPGIRKLHKNKQLSVPSNQGNQDSTHEQFARANFSVYSDNIN